MNKLYDTGDKPNIYSATSRGKILLFSNANLRTCSLRVVFFLLSYTQIRARLKRKIQPFALDKEISRESKDRRVQRKEPSDDMELQE